MNMNEFGQATEMYRKTEMEIMDQDIQNTAQSAVSLGLTHSQVLKRLSRLLCDNAMLKNGNNQTKAANDLGINRGTLRKILKVNDDDNDEAQC